MTIPPPSDPVQATFIRALKHWRKCKLELDAARPDFASDQLRELNAAESWLLSLDPDALGSSASPSSPSASEGGVVNEAMGLSGYVMFGPSTAGSTVPQPSEGLEAIRKRLQERLPLMREGAYLIALTRSDVEAILSALMSFISPSQSEAEKALACINCGEANDGGYETGREGDPDEGAVGPFCSECWSLLREDAKIESSELERLVKEWQEASNDSTFAPSDATKRRHVAAVKALLAWGKADPSSPAGTVEDP